MNRQQAVGLLKELVVSKLIEPSWISIEKTKDVYKLKIKTFQKTLLSIFPSSIGLFPLVKQLLFDNGLYHHN